MGRLCSGPLVLRQENWGGLILDQRHDRIWGASEEMFGRILSACLPPDRTPAEVSRGPEESDCAGFLARYGPGASGHLNPYRLSEFFLGNLPRSDGFDLAAPISISWCITNRCQSTCVFCCTDSHPGAHHGLSTEENIRIVDRLAEWGVLRVIIGGGEPLLRTDLPVILQHAADRGIRPTIATNGLIVPAIDLAPFRETVMMMQVSLDSLDDSTYHHIRGTQAGATRVKEAIRFLAEAAIPTRVVTVLTQLNEGELEELGDYCAATGVAQWFVFFVQPSGRARRDYQSLVPKRTSDCIDRLRSVAAKHANLSVSLWGTSSDDQLAVYVTSEGRLELFDYGTGLNEVLASLSDCGPSDLRRVWASVRPHAKYSTLVNFTSGARNPVALRSSL